jgi:serine/threonine protein kinase
MAEAGQLVGDYQVLAQLGVGGMGRVYKVRNVISNREEAMKILLPDFASDPDLARRFMAEIRTLATLEHPGIAQLRTAFQANNQFVMVMEYVEGTTLEKLAAATRIPMDKILDYAGQVLEALSYAHSRGVIHRDIKPANIMITTHGLVKLMDFGIAKSTDDMQLTRPGTTMGSVYYMSPEQVRGGTIDARSDLYSFGVTMYEMLTGHKPFQADTSYSVLNAQLNQAPTPPVEVNPAISPELNGIILRALAKAAEDRFQSAAEFRDALRVVRAAQSGPQPAAAVTPPRIATTHEIPTFPSAGLRAETVVSTPSTGTVVAPQFSPTVVAPQFSATVVAPPAPAASATPSSGWAPVPGQGQSGYAQPAQSAPVSFAPAQAAPAQFAPARVAASKSHRGLWITLGAVTAILALAAIATVLPRYFSTHATPKANVAAVDNPAPAPGPTAPVNSDPGPKPAPPVTPDPHAGGSGSHDSTPAPRQVDNPGKNSPRQPYQPDPTKHLQPPDSGNSGGQMGSNGAGTPPPPTGPSAKELRDAHDRYSNLEARADAAEAGVQQIRSQQQAAGYDIRGDILASMNRLRNNMRDADRAISQQDLATAGDYMNRAETEIATLEKFLGR